MRGCSIAAALAVAVLAPLALAPAAAGAEERVRVSASERYERNVAHRFAFGGGYRELWRARIELPVLDLAREGGGLVPSRRFGGLQTAVLAFEGADGRSYTFRGTDKDPSAVLDPLLRETFVETLVQDQMAAQHPGAPLAAGVVSEAAGVLTFHERMVVMPDDPALGEFREEFAGMVGTFYEFPQPAAEGRPGFHGATEIIDHEELYGRLAAGYDDRVDASAFLRARLLDLLLGDFDRHRKQWRWAKLPGNPLWQPLPEDRDMAFVRYEGVGPRLGYLYVPILQQYGPEYPWIKGLTLHGWEQDRWLLPALSWADWEPIARDLQERISDEVIERAVAALPPEYARLDGERLRHDLRGRRDRLVEGARSFYLHLAREVDIQGRDAAERVEVTHSPDQALTVEVWAQEGDGPRFARRFEPDETRDVRLYLRSGPDQVTVRGEPGAIRLRVVGAGGPGALDDSASGDAILYDSEGAFDVVAGERTRVDREPYVRPEEEFSFTDVEDVPPRDWGSDLIPLPAFGYERDVGAYVGAGALYTRYGFRKHPWSSRHRIEAGWAFDANQPRVAYTGRFRRENSELMGWLEILASGIETLRFYGFGNETSDSGADRLFRVNNEQFRVASRLDFPMSEHVRASAGPWVEFSRTNSGARLIDMIQPYGSGGFGSVGVLANVRYDTRTSLPDEDLRLALPLHDNVAGGYPLSGVLLDLTTALSPPIWDVTETWGYLEGSAAVFYSPLGGDRVTASLRVGGKRTFGRTPYFAAAYIGGGEFFGGNATVRGYRAQRFGGDASIFSNAELRVLLGRLKVLVPSDIGLLGFGDVGRVFVDGQSSDRWHPSGGGGVWIAPLARTNALSFSVARSPEETLFYLRLGFHY